MKPLFLAIVLALASSAAAQSPITVHIFTAHDPGGLVDEATTERLKTIPDVKKRLATQANLQVVETPEEARIIVEVISVGAEAITTTTTTVVGAAAISQPGAARWKHIARATIRSGTFTTNIETSLGPFGRTYGENLARKVEDWVKQNRAALTKE
jgi:hypothetical protein